MGRRKIDIEFIREDRSRATTFIKRKSGLFKKAHELAILTGAQVAVVVFSQQDRLFTYSNAPCSGICTKFLENPEPYETKGPQDYSANNDNDDDTDEESAAVPPTSRKSSIATHGRTNSNNVSNANGQDLSPKSQGRRDSLQTSPRASPGLVQAPITRDVPADVAAKRASSPRQQKRGPSPTQDRVPDGSKYLKHEQATRELSDIRSSPHQTLPSRSGSLVPPNTPPMNHTPEFTSTHMSAPMVPPPHMYSQQASSVQIGGPQYVPYSQHGRQIQLQQQQQMTHEQQSYDRQQREQQQQQQQHQYSQTQQQQQQRHPGEVVPFQRVGYGGPQYDPPQSNTRRLPMAPPLSIPATVPSSSSIIAQPSQQQQSQIEAQKTVGQPLLPPGTAGSGPSRVLLRGEGEGTGLTPIESPSNFASTLYSSTGISGIGTNISMPRISTDVGSLFYNWNTNEPGLSPATSMMLNQFREGDAAGSAGGGNPLAPPGPGRNPPTSGPPISAGVLENFSPTTAQWLSGHGIPPPQVSGSKPF